MLSKSVLNLASQNATAAAMIVFYVLTTITVIIYAIYYYSKRKFNYWKQQNVPHLEPTPIFGNYKDYILMKRYFGETTQRICSKFPNEPCIGTFYGTEPALLIQDPELIKLVTTKDFYYFSSREIANYADHEVGTQIMFFTYGDRWRVLRQNSTALFSSVKMKNMFHLIEKCCQQFQDLLDKESKSNSVEVMSLTSRFTMDVIGSCVFGVNTNVMTNAEGNPFVKVAHAIAVYPYLRAIKLVVRAIWPGLFYGLGLRLYSPEIDGFFNKLMTDVFEARNYEPSSRNDFVDLMIGIKKKESISGDSIRNLKTGKDEKVSLKVDDNFLVAQSLQLLAAGFETSSNTMSYALYELAKNEEAQKRVLEEVDAYMLCHKNKLEYECVSELPFLEACVDETLRLYPVLGVLAREVVEDYTLPSGVLLKKGVRIHLPVYHIHRKPEFFPEPEKFRPERFFGEEKRNVIPYTYLPFGEGPRICIGMRFARMTMMAALITILKSYRVELAAGMPSTLKFDPRALATAPLGGIHLRLVAREGLEERVFAS